MRIIKKRERKRARKALLTTACSYKPPHGDLRRKLERGAVSRTRGVPLVRSRKKKFRTVHGTDHVLIMFMSKRKKENGNPREGWEDGTLRVSEKRVGKPIFFNSGARDGTNGAQTPGPGTRGGT